MINAFKLFVTNTQAWVSRTSLTLSRSTWWALSSIDVRLLPNLYVLRKLFICLELFCVLAKNHNAVFSCSTLQLLLVGAFLWICFQKDYYSTFQRAIKSLKATYKAVCKVGSTLATMRLGNHANTQKANPARPCCSSSPTAGLVCKIDFSQLLISSNFYASCT